MIVVNVIIETKEADIAEMKSVLSKMEQASQAEDGCDDYTFSVEVNNPNVLRLTEKWTDMDALKSHFKTTHMAEFQAAMRSTPPVSSKASFYEAKEVSPPA